MQPNRHSIAIIQALQNAYIGCAVVHQMAYHQHKIDLRQRASDLGEQCQTVILNYRNTGHFPLEKQGELLEKVSRLARDAWSPIGVKAGEKFNLRIVNDIARAEHHLHVATGNADLDPDIKLEPVRDLSDLIDHLNEESHEVSDPASPYQKMLTDQSRTLIDTGLKASKAMEEWFAGAPLSTEPEPGTPDNEAESADGPPKRACRAAKLPDPRTAITSRSDLDTWFSNVASCNALPDQRLIHQFLEDCSNNPGRSASYANALSDNWCKQFINLSSDWTDHAAKTLAQAACGTVLDTMDKTAGEQMAESLATASVDMPAASTQQADGPQETISDHKARNDDELDNLVSRRERLLAELDNLDDRIDSHPDHSSGHPTC